MRFLAPIAALVLMVVPATAASDCADSLFKGREPQIANAKMSAMTQELCYLEFALLYSGQTRTPLWSAEHLTADRVAAAAAIDRVNTFHAEKALPVSWRSKISDYSKSQYDRGHMSPSDDMSTAEAQGQSFSLANMVPQNPRLNRVLWYHIENAVRSLASQGDDIYVVTGPLFEGDTLQSLKGRVLIPTATFKAVYDATAGEAGAYVASNDASGNWQVETIDDLDTIAGMDVFPAVPPAVKSGGMQLPNPR